MRILNISYQNINSLEGQGRVDFDQGPIADSGVFAITGPNGSGKTSILDVITLAMYGETFRFDKPAEHVITKHADASMAQAEFIFAGEKYRSLWQVTRSNPASPDMQLWHLNGEPQLMAETPHQVRQRLAELTGMDFHRFTKSMVLPQGDFAAFLNALDSERLDILEKISGADFYADYRRQTEAKHAQCLENAKLFESELGLLPVLNPEALEAAEHDLQDFQDLSTELKQEQQQVNQQLQALQKLESVQDQHAKLQAQQQGLLMQIQEQQAALQRIEAAAPAALYREDLQTFDRRQNETAQSRISLNTLRSELDMLQRQLAAENQQSPQNQPPNGKTLETQKQVIDSLKLKLSEIKLDLPRQKELSQVIQLQLAEKQATLTEVEAWLQAHQTDAVLISDFPAVAQLRKARQDLLELSAQQKTQSGWSKHASAAMQKNQTDLTANQTRLEELKQQILADENTLIELARQKTFAELQSLLRDQEIRHKDFQQLMDLASLNDRLSKKKGLFGWFSKKPDSAQVDQSKLQAQIYAIKLDLSSDENITKALEQAIANESLLRKLTIYRSKLVAGKPCYLCGSSVHPYSMRPPVFTDSKKALADQRAKVLVLKATLETYENQLAAVQKREGQLSAKEKFLTEKRSEWATLANRLNVVRSGLNITNLAMQKQLLAEEAAELEKLKNLVNTSARLQRDIAKAKAELEAKQPLLAKLRISSEQLNAAWAERSPEMQEFIEKLAGYQADEKTLTAKLELQLKLLGEKLPAKGKEDALIDRLNSRRQDYQIRELRQTGLREEITDLEAKLQACLATINRYQQQLSDNQETLHSAEWLGLQLAILEKQKLIANQEQQCQALETALASLRRDLLAKIAQHGFTGLQQLTEALQLIDGEADLHLALERHAAQLESLNADLLKLATQLQQHRLAVDETVGNIELRALQQLLAEKIDIAELEVRGLQNKLRKQQNYRLKYEQIQRQLSEAQQRLAESSAEMAQIQDNSSGLRRVIQKLLIEKLLSQANKILEKISDRYYLRSIDSEYGLALAIQDSKQNNVQRQPKTLSGGESFVVSLALSLALAEIANNGAAIDSLFLDEGFGNLDADALYLAMSALESLKIQGKTVGVISHVEGVKKRIKTRIEMVKKANGFSELKMVA